jgi:hypothetical protein
MLLVAMVVRATLMIIASYRASHMVAEGLNFFTEPAGTDLCGERWRRQKEQSSRGSCKRAPTLFTRFSQMNREHANVII